MQYTPATHLAGDNHTFGNSPNDQHRFPDLTGAWTESILSLYDAHEAVPEVTGAPAGALAEPPPGNTEVLVS